MALPAFAEVQLDYNKFADRFVTTVKEAQVDADFLQVDEVKSCIEEITAADLQGDQKALREKQAKSANCVRQKMEEIAKSNPDQLTSLAEKLQLDAFGVIKGKSSKEIIDFFSSRLENALYGKGPDGKPARLKDQKIVDQKVFADIYETQLGKNILLEISQYCQGRIRKIGSVDEDRFNAIEAMQENFDPSEWTDLEIKSTLTADSNIYSDFVEKVIGPAKDDPELVKRRLKTLFNNCTTIIPKMCALYEACSCKYKKDNPPADGSPVDCTVPQNISCPSTTSEPKIGQHSCHVVARLRGYRTNLTAVKETQKQFSEMSGGTAIGLTKAKEVYDKTKAQDGESVDDLTSLSSKEVEMAIKEQGTKQQGEALEKAACEESPESPECEKFFYKEDEVLKFANSSVGYAAATAVESARISALAKESDKLKEYLTLKGYFDLAEKVEGGANTEEIIRAAKQRFETEREATFKEMSAAFDRKQLVTGTDTQKKERVIEAKKEVENRSKSFQQLMLFNNVVTSYLELKRPDGSAIGSNIKALQREVQGMEKIEAANSSVQFFSGLATGESGVTNGESPLVDINFLDSVLGSKEAQDAEKNTNPSDVD
jgi:hypothetical protein